MGDIVILCNRTGKLIPAAFDVSRRDFEAIEANEQYSAYCWECGGRHVWSKRWAEYIEAAEAQVHPVQRGAA